MAWMAILRSYSFIALPECLHKVHTLIWLCCLVLQVELFGQDVLEYYGLDGYTAWEFIAYEIIFFIGFFVLCWLALALKKHQKR